MADMYFEDLPSTNTPLIANNVNKLNDIKVSATEPTTGEKVWVQKSKNLFDGILEQGNIDTSTGANSSVDASNFTRSVNYHKVEPNTSYTLNINRQNNQIVVYYYNNSTFLSFDFAMNTATYTFVTPSDCTCVRFRFSGSITIREGQLEKGTEATTYEAYTEKKVYTKNNNTYEEYVNLSKLDDIEGNLQCKPVFTNIILDSQTVTVSLESSLQKFYIWINSHINIREMFFLTYVSPGQLRVDTIFTSGNESRTNFTTDGDILTINAAANCRGQLYSVSQKINT